MSANFHRPNLKRPLPIEEDEFNDEDEQSQKSSMQKKVRFPKKKAKHGDERVEVSRPEAVLSDPRVAAKERAARRGQMTTALVKEDRKGLVDDISTVEVDYEDYETFVEDGIQIEPFSLNKEREDGYFDANMNFIEYVKEKESKDAWLDSLEVAPQYTGKITELSKNDDEVEELTSREIGMIKRRIADFLEPGETILQALRRLKGNSSSRKEKMSLETKSTFDQITEDAMKLLESGEYDVYNQKQEIFQREAEGYESLARARDGVSSISTGQESSEKDIISESFDMFGDEEPPTANPPSEVSGASNDGTNLTNPQNNNPESGTSQSDYVYDESTGYYYSSSLGYYYDPSTGLYCSAASEQWYSFNEETGTYDEVQAATSNTD